MKKVHIISHSHWDREWYMPYEKHHMRLINLIDGVLDAIENDPDFQSFHLDGQTICIEDYLAVKPPKREQLLSAIKNGKIKIGPWYILQDAFLTSSEANVRNLQYGDLDAKRYGAKTSVGYFPDTFGIYSQAPQLLKLAGIDNMVFGRGVSTTGFNNQVSSDFESKYSEMIIEADDGTKVLGILFANWYSNGNEIPTEPIAAKKYWEQKLADCMKYTNSDHLLIMNGCDHTPYQSDVTAAIKVANQLFTDYEFIQSNFDDYLKAIKAEMKNENLTVIKNELTSQMTDGYYTLVNTASSRINQKIKNIKIQALYEQLVEPMLAFYQPVSYPHEKLEYGWKKLMQNHPHDSICGCSVDQVHDLMDSRFAASQDVGESLLAETLEIIQQQTEYLGSDLAFCLINPGTLTNKVHEVELEIDRELFNDSFTKARDKMLNVKIPNYQLVDEEGQVYPVKITDLGIKFGYLLPKDVFRRPYYSRNIKLNFWAEVPNFCQKAFYLKVVENQQSNELETTNLTQLENNLVQVTINPDCSISVYDKQSQKISETLMEIIDQGDIGNEYMFGAVSGDQAIKIENYQTISATDQENISTRIVNAQLVIPKQATTDLATEQLHIVEYKDRAAKRSSEMIKLNFTIKYELAKNDPGVKVTINFTNKALDHRIRVNFKTAFKVHEHQAESVFNITKRPNQPSLNWQNPNNDQRMFRFMQIGDEKMTLTIATNGLHEYEVIDNNVSVTICRSVGELGDWGHFPTPNAQELKPVEAEFKLYFNHSKNRFSIANQARSAFINQPAIQLQQQSGMYPANRKLLDLSFDDNCFLSTIKRNQANQLIVRLASNGLTANYQLTNKFQITDLLELNNFEVNGNVINPGSIVTLKVDDNYES